MRTIDGSTGGGQILRTSLSLSGTRGEPFRIRSIRAGRKRPGLMAQHLVAVRAAAAACGAEVQGDEIGSDALEFRPGAPRGGSFAFEISTAGSTGLVLQTVLPLLLEAPEPSEVVLTGGTHNPWAPPFEFLAESFLPALAGIGVDAALELERHGFFPRGGGRVRARVAPWSERRRLALHECGDLVSKEAEIVVAGAAEDVAKRQSEALRDTLRWPEHLFRVTTLRKRHGPGNAALVRLRHESVAAVFTAFGMRRVTPEKTGSRLGHEVRHWIDARAPVDARLADQLLLPLALGRGGAFSTSLPLSDHFVSNAALLEEWGAARIGTEELGPKSVRVDVEPRSA